MAGLAKLGSARYMAANRYTLRPFISLVKIPYIIPGNLGH